MHGQDFETKVVQSYGCLSSIDEMPRQCLGTYYKALCCYQPFKEVYDLLEIPNKRDNKHTLIPGYKITLHKHQNHFFVFFRVEVKSFMINSFLRKLVKKPLDRLKITKNTVKNRISFPVRLKTMVFPREEGDNGLFKTLVPKVL